MPPHAFIADVMLGSLARWLRILGFDAAYDSQLDDADLVERAVREKRLILTRDRRLVLRRRARQHLLIGSDRVDEQLRQVLGELGLTVSRARLFGRCLRCNVELAEISAERARRRVPPFVAATQPRYRVCPDCDRIYWRATHVERMLSRLETMGVELA